jgi:hypothetical protein
VSFEEIVTAKVVKVKDSHNREGQKMVLYEYKNYIWLVPFVQKDDEIFLKTLYPSRKYTKIYRRGEKR